MVVDEKGTGCTQLLSLLIKYDKYDNENMKRVCFENAREEETDVTYFLSFLLDCQSQVVHYS